VWKSVSSQKPARYIILISCFTYTSTLLLFDFQRTSWQDIVKEKTRLNHCANFIFYINNWYSPMFAFPLWGFTNAEHVVISRGIMSDFTPMISQQLLTHSAVTNSIVLDPLDTPKTSHFWSFSLLTISNFSYHCPNWSKSKSKWRYDLRSVSQYVWCRAQCGTCDQILIISESCCFVSVGHLLWREVGSVLSVTVRSICPLSIFVFLFTFSFYMSHMFYVYTYNIHKAPVSPGLVQQIMSHHL
jgi:hypothetical protein